MYRLLKLRHTNIQPLRSVSFAHTPLINERTCNLCHQIHNASKTQVVFQSTHTSPHIAPKKARKKRAIKKNYTDMLIVKDSSTSEVKARIKNLKPNDIKMLALTNLKLNELYKLKDFLKSNASDDALTEHSYNNLADFSNIPLQEEVVSASCELIAKPDKSETDILPRQFDAEIEEEMEAVIEQTDELLHNVKTIPFQPEIVEEEVTDETPDIVEQLLKEKQQKRVKYTGDRRAREEVIARTLAAYVEVCAGLKNPHRGLNAFTFYRHRCKLGKNQNDRYPPISSVHVYNALLKGFAAKGDFRRLQEILGLAKEEGVRLNVQSYAAIFECIGRVNFNDSHTRFIRMYTKEALQNEITFDRILNEASFLYDQREKVIGAMQTHDINFKPKYWEPSVHYTNGLVNGLNHEDQQKGLQECTAGKPGIFSKEMLTDWTQKQMDMERNVMITVKSIEAKPEPTEEVIRFRELWSEHTKLWESAAGEAFSRDLLALTAQRSALNYDLYMRSIPTKDIIAIMVGEAQKIAQGSESYSPTTTMLYRDLGSKVYARYKVLKKQKTGVLDKIMKVHSKYVEDYAESHRTLDVLPERAEMLNTRQKWQWAEHSFKHEGATIAMDHQEWTPAALLAIGKFLYNIIMHDLKIDVNSLRANSKHKNYLPAFYTIFRTQGRAIKEEVKPHPVLSKLYRASVPETLSFPAYELPMRCPPVPWTSVTNGGYLIAPCEVVRLPSQATAQKHRMRKAVANQLFPSLDSLNQLASVPWKVNGQILDVIMEVFRNGGSAKLDVPELPSSLPPPTAVQGDLTKTEKHTLFRQRLQYRRKKAEMYSLWCDCLYRLSLANHFRDDVFWLPHNMDFRGRVYPIPPHLNHLGSDLARSMLVFAESRPLGPNGLDWLKLHLVNLTGLKKRDSLDGRLQFANSILPDILDSADRPLDGKRWWAESDEPWQTLACCMEIAAASRSPNSEEYRSHFPVHQDGSCNGLQHYAALGRDSAGAFSVNLSPAQVPQDVYSAVVVLVEERRRKDAESGLEIAKVLDGFVKRKVIKQTVMTTVYGVTRFGARLQIARQLKDIDEFPKDFVWAGSNYLTARTFDSLRTMFTSTREIQDWFTDCARLISSVCAENVEWVTPLGLPVVQPYLRYKKLGNGYENFLMDSYEKPNVMKQKNAFPPNFIHSLDSSHMMLTSLNCERAGITFVSVHDCYWTHPSTVHIMNKVCREQFVALHSEPILEDLSNFMTEKYSYQDDEIQNDGSVMELTKRKLNRVLRKLPKTGDFNIDEVIDSVYFFS